MVISNKKIFLLGPTASGKTELVKYLYELFPIEIISVDSAQIYKNLDIGTAKLSKKEFLKTPHHLIDIRSPIESYSVGDFKKDVDKITNESIKNQKIPFLCGGTMMYFNSLEKPSIFLNSHRPGDYADIVFFTQKLILNKMKNFPSSFSMRRFFVFPTKIN